jgi:hypothetical protein
MRTAMAERQIKASSRESIIRRAVGDVINAAGVEKSKNNSAETGIDPVNPEDKNIE